VNYCWCTGRLGCCLGVMFLGNCVISRYLLMYVFSQQFLSLLVEELFFNKFLLIQKKKRDVKHWTRQTMKTEKKRRKSFSADLVCYFLYNFFPF
jgi:hypothetical protein